MTIPTTPTAAQARSQTETSTADAIAAFITDGILLGTRIDIAATPSFLDAGLLDSTGVLELVQYLEERFELTIEDHEIVPANLDSLAAIVRYVENKRASRSARC